MVNDSVVDALLSDLSSKYPNCQTVSSCVDHQSLAHGTYHDVQLVLDSTKEIIFLPSYQIYLYFSSISVRGN